MGMINEIIGMTLMVIGGLYYILSSIGLIRMKDSFNRLQASTQSSTLGVFSILIGVGIFNTDFLLKAIVIVIFIIIKNPIGGSSLARAAHTKASQEGEEGCF